MIYIDPGGKPCYIEVGPPIHRGRAWLDQAYPRIVRVDLSWVDRPAPDGVVCEAQDLAGDRSHGHPLNIVMLARRAGGQAYRAAKGAPVYFVPAQIWRQALHVTSLTKEQVQHRILVALTPEERALLPMTQRIGDCLDATAIAWAASRLDLKKFLDRLP